MLTCLLDTDSEHELGPDVHPLGLRLDQKAEYAASVVIYDGEQVEVPLRCWHGEWSSEIRMETLGLAFGTLEPVTQLWLLVCLAHHTGSARGRLLRHRDVVLASKVGKVAVAMAQVQLPQHVRRGRRQLHKTWPAL